MSYSNDSTDRLDEERASPKKKWNRRRSVADQAAMTQAYIQENIDTLTELWDVVHMNEENRVARLHTAYEHIRTLVDDMVAGETKMVESVKAGITEGQEKIQNLRLELKMGEWECRHPYPSIALLREVEKEEKSLREIYDARKVEQERLIELLDNLCTRLGKNPLEYLPDACKKLLPRGELEKMKSIVAELETSLAERIKVALGYQRDLRMWYRNLGQYYGDNDEAALKVFLEENIEDENFLLTTSILDRLQQLWQEMSGMHESWLQNMDIEWMTRYEDLQVLWDSCHVSEQERIYGARFDPTRNSQADIDAMSDEIMRLKAVYSAREPIYKLLSDWKDAWKQKIDMEEKKKDASYYQSRERGHNLMRDAQHERHINEVRLPGLKKSIVTAYTDYKKNHSEDRILIEGYEPIEFIEWTEDEHKLSRERERNAKLAAKKQATTPSVPKTPQTLKSRVGSRTPAVPSSVPAKQPRLTSDPQFSIITPTRTQDHGPKTSSPKQSATAPSTPKRLLSPLKKKNH